MSWSVGAGKRRLNARRVDRKRSLTMMPWVQENVEGGRTAAASCLAGPDLCDKKRLNRVSGAGSAGEGGGGESLAAARQSNGVPI